MPSDVKRRTAATLMSDLRSAVMVLEQTIRQKEQCDRAHGAAESRLDQIISDTGEALKDAEK